ncbi:MAG TPA: zinc-binding dehydrogenase [Solirubrobacteraceae bacterium]|nr:zinc-binding dehydrogenase [Solirubrobacteraceae bacterium]
MRAAVLEEHGATPRLGDFAEPGDAPGCVVVEVAAAGLHHLDLHKASGTFYMGPPPLPSVCGTDGVGRLPDGRRVYFDATVAPYGSMAEKSLARADALLDVAEGADDATAAALGNTGLGAWLALSWRAALQPGETVLVLGATGAVGTVAVQAAKLLGAGRVVAADRAGERLATLRERGADAVVEIDAPGDLTDALREAAEGDVHVTVDMLWGAPALAAMQVAGRWARHVEVGNMAGAEIALPAPLLRSVSLDLRGFSVAHPPVEVRGPAYLRLTEHAARGDLAIDVDAVPLDDVAAAWERQRQAAGGPKIVLLP